ncbi:hypothetical protein [Legionella sainthelensi]|nr:hypothetical protein [Legionella sainthelensi]
MKFSNAPASLIRPVVANFTSDSAYLDKTPIEVCGGKTGTSGLVHT